MRPQHRGTGYARTALAQGAADLSGFYDRIADLVGRPVQGQVLLPVSVPAFTGLNDTTAGDGPRADAGEGGGVAVLGRGGSDGRERDLVRVITTPHHPHLLWVQEHLHHLSASAQTVSDPALRLAEVRQRPWWR
jgi:hypothetical protein